MKSLIVKLLALVIFSFVLFSCSAEDDGIYFDETSEIIDTDISYSKIELEILELINNHRQEIGLKSLSALNIVSGVAHSHTDYMIETGQISHDNFEKRSEILMSKTNAKSVGENVAYGYNSAQGAVNGWLNSETHRRVIENPNYTHFGISTDANNEGRNYFTQIFIKK